MDPLLRSFNSRNKARADEPPGLSPFGCLATTYSHMEDAPHYHRRWTVSLPSSEWDRVVPARSSHQAKRMICCFGTWMCGPKWLGCYMVKPHGQLVLVSSTHCCAYTPSLSTSSSSTDLEGSCDPGRSHLEGGFPLRCFQQLSRPYIATRLCHWRDNRNTRGTSTPVLSY